MRKIVLLLLLLPFSALSGNAGGVKKSGLEMAVKMADSEIKQFPEPWTVDFNPKPVWNYTQGLVALSMTDLWKETKNEVYYNYAKLYADKMIDASGNIAGYKIEDYNIDCVNSGKFLFDLYEKTKDEKYRKAIILLRNQLKTQPRTSEGGFWHKKRYPYQMWLDGLYMGAPFYAQYAKVFNEPELFDDVVNQFVTVHKYTYDPKTGLNYHGWDESKQQKWADSVTGCSPNFWGRAEGWYAMALVDVLDFLPSAHPGRAKLLGILNQVAAGIKKHQDPKTGLWYQVMDLGGREGNYLEATGSAMFAYTLLKAVRKGYIPDDYKAVAIKGYNGMLENLIKENGNGTISLTKCCGGAGLGGNPYRDGSYDYYINEEVRDNDPKGVAPFIMASIEYNAQDRQLVAFPGAEGAGKFTKGGRGGDVCHVTNLDDSGKGSLRDAIKTINGPRTIVFDIAGTIRLKSHLEVKDVSYLTIAGQTAPGKGITIADYTVKIHNSKHIILRYLRIRLGDENKPPQSGFDVIEVNYDEDLILDHLSLSWGIDGNGDFRGLKNTTIQWCIFSEALNQSLHEKGDHGMCSSFRDPKGPASIHHNIYASSRNRHPTINGGPEVTEFCNNIDYNWTTANNLSGEKLSVIGNYYKAGPSMSKDVHPIQFKSDKGAPVSKGYLSGNYFDGLPSEYNKDNYTAMNYDSWGGPDSKYQGTTRDKFRSSKRFDAGIYKLANVESAQEAYKSCLKYGGCSLDRDLVDERFLKTIINNTGKLINSQKEVGGWDFYPQISRPANWDTDGDGMPDNWEKQNGLNPNDAADRNGDRNKDGFTNLEEYSNSLVSDKQI